jgi:hypothetical protein
MLNGGRPTRACAAARPHVNPAYIRIGPLHQSDPKMDACGLTQNTQNLVYQVNLRQENVDVDSVLGSPRASALERRVGIAL